MSVNGFSNLNQQKSLLKSKNKPNPKKPATPATSNNKQISKAQPVPDVPWLVIPSACLITGMTYVKLMYGKLKKQLTLGFDQETILKNVRNAEYRSVIIGAVGLGVLLYITQKLMNKTNNNENQKSD